jgi:hypothetical protein
MFERMMHEPCIGRCMQGRAATALLLVQEMRMHGCMDRWRESILQR